MSDEKVPLRIRYEYEQNPETRMQFAHGVWGGINPQGEIEMNFYTESDKFPPYSERLLTPDGSFGHEIAPQDDTQKTVVRTINTRLVLNYHTARAVIDWLQEKVDALEQEFEEGAFMEGMEGDGSVPQ